MQRNGWITPQFESSARELIDAKEKTQKAQGDMAALDIELPLLQKARKTTPRRWRSSRRS